MTNGDSKKRGRPTVSRGGGRTSEVSGVATSCSVMSFVTSVLATSNSDQGRTACVSDTERGGYLVSHIADCRVGEHDEIYGKVISHVQ